MYSASPKAGPSRKRRFCRSRDFAEQIRVFFVYHLMKLLILGVVAIVMLAVGSGAACLSDSDGFWRWRDEARERAIEARHLARERAREFRNQQREEMRALRERRDRIREEIRDEMRDARRDWRYTY
jgi:hypothetical protein